MAFGVTPASIGRSIITESLPTTNLTADVRKILNISNRHFHYTGLKS